MTKTLWTTLWNRLNEQVLRTWIAVAQRLEPVDERGGGRNTDEGFHIGAGAVIAGTIAAGVAAFVAKKLGALG